MNSNKKQILLKYGIALAVGLAAAVVVMWYQGAFSTLDRVARAQYVSDGFFVSGILMLIFGIMLWVSTTGFFDIFGYAIRSAAHMLLPFMGKLEIGTYYDYHMSKEEKRGKPQYFLMLCGAFYILCSVIALLVYYRLAG